MIRVASAALLAVGLLAACDSAEDSGLADCRFTATVEGALAEKTVGRAYSGYGLVFTGDTTALRSVEMQVSARNGEVFAMRLRGSTTLTLAAGVYAIDTVYTGALPYWELSVSTPDAYFLSTRGTVEIFSASDAHLEGRFEVGLADAPVASLARTVTVRGRFNARERSVCQAVNP